MWDTDWIFWMFVAVMFTMSVIIVLGKITKYYLNNYITLTISLVLLKQSRQLSIKQQIQTEPNSHKFITAWFFKIFSKNSGLHYKVRICILPTWCYLVYNIFNSFTSFEKKKRQEKKIQKIWEVKECTENKIVSLNKIYNTIHTKWQAVNREV